MNGRSARILVVAVLALLALDVVDGGCLEQRWAGDLECSAGEACGCCVASEAPAALAAAPPLARIGAAFRPPGDPRLDGVPPAPYRPPLLLG